MRGVRWSFGRLAQGEHAKVVAERLGHSSISATFDVYGHLMQGPDDDVADRLAASRQTEPRTKRAPNGVAQLIWKKGDIPLTRGFVSGRYWDRTSDLCRVKAE